MRMMGDDFGALLGAEFTDGFGQIDSEGATTTSIPGLPKAERIFESVGDDALGGIGAARTTSASAICWARSAFSSSNERSLARFLMRLFMRPSVEGRSYSCHNPCFSRNGYG